MPYVHTSVHLRDTDSLEIQSAFPESEYALDAMFLAIKDTAASPLRRVNIHFDSLDQMRKLRDTLNRTLDQIARNSAKAEQSELQDQWADAEGWE